MFLCIIYTKSHHYVGSINTSEAYCWQHALRQQSAYEYRVTWPAFRCCGWRLVVDPARGRGPPAIRRTCVRGRASTRAQAPAASGMHVARAREGASQVEVKTRITQKARSRELYIQSAIAENSADVRRN